jgi:hypothetical protein
MRARLKIDDDIFKEAEALAVSENRSIGEILSDLARQGLRVKTLKKKDSGFPKFSVPEGTPPITMEMVRSAESDS